MKYNEVIAGHLSPCVQIFIESLLNGESTKSVSKNTGGTDISRGIKESGAENDPTEAYRD
jgi:hypothetical protein